MGNISVYDKDASPVSTTLTDDGVSTTALAYGEKLLVGTRAMANGTDTFRLEIREIGGISTYQVDNTPTPRLLAAILLNDAMAWISDLAVHPDGSIFFAVCGGNAANTAVYRWTRQSPTVADGGPNLAANDSPSPSGSNQVVLGVLHEEVVAGYFNKIRVRDGAGTWANPAITPAPTNYAVRGMHNFKEVLYIFVDADYAGEWKAEVWKYTGNGATIVVDQTYTGTYNGVAQARWAHPGKYYRGQKVAGIYQGALYASYWTGGGNAIVLVKRTASAWSTILTSTSVPRGPIIESRGKIYGIGSTGGTTPATTWTSVSIADGHLAVL